MDVELRKLSSLPEIPDSGLCAAWKKIDKISDKDIQKYLDTHDSELDEFGVYPDTIFNFLVKGKDFRYWAGVLTDGYIFDDSVFGYKSYREYKKNGDLPRLNAVGKWIFLGDKKTLEQRRPAKIISQRRLSSTQPFFNPSSALALSGFYYGKGDKAERSGEIFKNRRARKREVLAAFFNTIFNYFIFYFRCTTKFFNYLLINTICFILYYCCPGYFFVLL